MDADDKLKHYAADGSDAEEDAPDREDVHPGEDRPKDDDVIIDLVDVAEEPAEDLPPRDVLPEALEKEVIRIAEKVAREMFPDIAERIIREEIEKLKEKL